MSLTPSLHPSKVSAQQLQCHPFPASGLPYSPSTGVASSLSGFVTTRRHRRVPSNVKPNRRGTATDASLTAVAIQPTRRSSSPPCARVEKQYVRSMLSALVVTCLQAQRVRIRLRRDGLVHTHVLCARGRMTTGPISAEKSDEGASARSPMSPAMRPPQGLPST